MSRLNVSFDHAQKVSKPIHGKNNGDISFSRTNRTVLDSSFRSTRQKKYTSFAPSTTLAEYNQVAFVHSNIKNKLPDLNMPQRIELPPYFNTPMRSIPTKQRDPSPIKKPGDSSFMSDLNKSNLDNSVLDRSKRTNRSTIENRPNSLNKYMGFVESDVKIGAMRRLKDLTFIAQACKRAGKVREEGRAYYSIGVLYDNIKEYGKAIKFYKKFLSLCRSINDINGEALAYNCLGVDYQLLGDLKEAGMYEQSIKYHEKHKDMANTAGKFTACVNLGLLYASMHDEKNAILFQQQALRYAVELADPALQGVAIGNLGKIGTLDMADNKTRMMAFVEKYLKICKATDNKQGEGEAHLKLGQLMADEKSYPDGIRNYQKALEIGREFNDNGIIEKAKLGYGIAQGALKMENYLNSMKKNMSHVL